MFDRANAVPVQGDLLQRQCGGGCNLSQMISEAPQLHADVTKAAIKEQVRAQNDDLHTFERIAYCIALSGLSVEAAS